VSDIFEEVEEAVLHDSMARRWKQARLFVYAGIAALIIGVASFEFMKWQKSESQQKAATEFYTAVKAYDTRDYALANALFSEIQNSDSPFAVLAGHYVAQTDLTGMGDRAAAIEALVQASEGEGPFAQTARLKVAYLQASEKEVADLILWLDPILADETSPYAFLAEEVIAARAFELGDVAEAKKRFTLISLSLDAPQGAKLRAEQALAAIQAIQQKNGRS
jgi:hypothetical protein